MVDDMLDVSKLEAGLLGAWRREAHITEIIRQIRPMLDKKAEVKHNSFDVSLEEDLPTIYCDPEKVGRVIVNLAINAMKFCGDPGVVRLWAKRSSMRNEIVVGVGDNGPGIDEEAVVSIFQRFKQLDTNIKSSTKGFGLGLSIAKELVDLNFGEMNVESLLGSGSTFSFSIPLALPVEVMKRYLNHVVRNGNGISVVSLVSVGVDPSVEDAIADDTNVFLNYLLRKHDLLFRMGTHQWVIAAATGEVEFDQFRDRALKAHRDANRNRPYGPLPPLDIEHEGAWRTGAESDVVLGRFNALVAPLEVVEA